MKAVKKDPGKYSYASPGISDPADDAPAPAALPGTEQKPPEVKAPKK